MLNREKVFRTLTTLDTFVDRVQTNLNPVKLFIANR